MKAGEFMAEARRLEQLNQDLKAGKYDVKRFCDYELDQVDHGDSPKYVDAYISSASAELNNGEFRVATEEELEKLNENGALILNLISERTYPY